MQWQAVFSGVFGRPVKGVPGVDDIYAVVVGTKLKFD